jgi:hypothetical protein
VTSACGPGGSESGTYSARVADLVTQGEAVAALAQQGGLCNNQAADGPYQSWYSVARRVVEQVLPERHDEFTRYYALPPGEHTVWAYDCTINELLLGQVAYETEVHHANDLGLSRLRRQVAIVASCASVLESTLADLRTSLAVQISEDELSEAQTLAALGHYRAAGVVAGVVIERALRRLSARHELPSEGAKAAVLNDRLKSVGVYDEPTRAKIQFLLAIRNKCSHPGDDDPTAEETNDLLSGADGVLHLLT